MKNESIKVGDKIYDIANGSCSLNNLSGYNATVAIIIGQNSIEDIHRNLSGNPTIIKYSVDGVEEWGSDSLVYTGKIRIDSEFPVRIDAITCSEVMDSVVIVEYRTPNIQDEIMAQRAQMMGLNADISRLSTITGVGVEVRTSGQLTLRN